MSGHRHEDVPRRFKVAGDVRLVDDRFHIPVRVFRGDAHVSTESAVLSVDDAALLEAQLTRLLCERAGLAPQGRKGALSPWRPY